MALRGRFLRREGTLAYFGTKSKPEWKPIEISGAIDPSQMVEGQFYELNLENNRLIGYRKLVDRAPGTYSPPQHGSGQSSSDGARAAPDAVPLQSLCASATGFAKSCLESGKGVEESIEAAMRWADLWGEVPKRSRPAPEPEPPLQAGEMGQPYDDW